MMLCRAVCSDGRKGCEHLNQLYGPRPPPPPLWRAPCSEARLSGSSGHSHTPSVLVEASVCPPTPCHLSLSCPNSQKVQGKPQPEQFSQPKPSCLPWLQTCEAACRVFLTRQGRKFPGQTRQLLAGVSLSSHINVHLPLQAWLIAVIILCSSPLLEAMRNKWLQFEKGTHLFVFDLSLQNAKVAGVFAFGQLILDEDSWSGRLLEQGKDRFLPDAEGSMGPQNRKWVCWNLLSFPVLVLFSL